ncbi:MAG: DUF2148 domain-containing protein [Bacteroidota bacterium]
MAIITDDDFRDNLILHIAEKMAVAARTAPKGRGIDNLASCILTGDDIKKLAKKMIFIGNTVQSPFFLRDAENIKIASAVLLLGTRIKTTGLAKCGMCGFADCSDKEKYPAAPCIFNINDLGIAIGSAVSIAADNRIDNRIMYTAGQAALELELLGKDVRVAFGIPLSATSKNPFFDRKL